MSSIVVQTWTATTCRRLLRSDRGVSCGRITRNTRRCRGKRMVKKEWVKKLQARVVEPSIVPKYQLKLTKVQHEANDPGSQRKVRFAVASSIITTRGSAFSDECYGVSQRFTHPFWHLGTIKSTLNSISLTIKSFKGRKGTID